MEQIRTAAAADVTAMAALAGIRREQYARYQPLFWRPAADALDKHRAYLASLIGDDEVITQVSEESGQLTGFISRATAASRGSGSDPLFAARIR